MVQYGAVCGRFQIFHLDHLQYCLAAAHRCEHLIVGITSPDKSVNPLETVDPHRCTDEANPCNYFERMKMIEAALLEAGLPREKFDIVPFPIGRPELISAYVPAGATIFVTVLDPWGLCKTERMKDHGYDVQVLWERNDKVISSSMIREFIRAGRDWSGFVPSATYRFICEQNIDKRIINM